MGVKPGEANGQAHREFRISGSFYGALFASGDKAKPVDLERAYSEASHYGLDRSVRFFGILGTGREPNLHGGVIPPPGIASPPKKLPQLSHGFMNFSAPDLFAISVGLSSFHTVGEM